MEPPRAQDLVSRDLGPPKYHWSGISYDNRRSACPGRRYARASPRPPCPSPAPVRSPPPPPHTRSRGPCRVGLTNPPSPGSRLVGVRWPPHVGVARPVDNRLFRATFGPGHWLRNHPSRPVEDRPCVANPGSANQRALHFLPHPCGQLQRRRTRGYPSRSGLRPDPPGADQRLRPCITYASPSNRQRSVRAPIPHRAAMVQRRKCGVEAPDRSSAHVRAGAHSRLRDATAHAGTAFAARGLEAMGHKLARERTHADAGLEQPTWVEFTGAGEAHSGNASPERRLAPLRREDPGFRTATFLCA